MMARSKAAPKLVMAGWQGMTAEIPEDWQIGAISGDVKQGYVRYDDGNMPRLELKWATESGFVDIEKVIAKYLTDLQKGRKKGAADIEVEKDTKLLSRRKRKKGSLRCFRWTIAGEAEGYGAAWVCTDCGRTVIAQVTMPAGGKADEDEELASGILLSINDHPLDGWTYWAAYGFGAWVPEQFKLSGQKLMAGLMEFDFEADTEKLKVARWGMAGMALRKKTLKEFIGSECSKTLRKNSVEAEEGEIKGHPGLILSGEGPGGVHKVRSFWAHCCGKHYADRFVGRAWHCEPGNKIIYIESLVDRAHTALVDEICDRIECHSGDDGGDGDD
jgi:hypothetical protein